MIVSVPDIDRRPSRAAAWRRGLTLAALALSLGLAACASVEAPPAPARSEPAPAEARPITPPPSPERKRLIDAFGGEFHAPATEGYLNGILVKLAQASDAANQPYRVTLLNSPVVNAFALPSGDIFLTRGLLALADDTAEIAAVMAHEIAHVTARHAAQRAEFAKTAALFARVNEKVLDHSQAPDEAEARSRLSIASFSREQEFEADQIGIKSLARAGYDPYGAARFLTALGEWSALSSSTSERSADRPDMMATHPSTPERIAQAEAEARGPRAARRRRDWPGRLSGGDRRPLVRRRSVPGRRARDPVHSSEARLRFRGAGRLHPREPVRRADRRRRRRRGGAAARQHSDLGFDLRRHRDRLRLDRRGEDDGRRNPCRSAAWTPQPRRRSGVNGASGSARCVSTAGSTA